jgi:VanZ family protein
MQIVVALVVPTTEAKKIGAWHEHLYTALAVLFTTGSNGCILLTSISKRAFRRNPTSSRCIAFTTGASRMLANSALVETVVPTACLISFGVWHNHRYSSLAFFRLNRTVRTFVTRWMPVIAWMLLIFAGSSDVLSAEHTSRFLVPFLLWLNPSMPYHTIEAIHLVFRKLGHVTEYAILAALLWRALRGSFNALSRRTVSICTFIVAATFAASDEFHQSFVPTRTATLHDVFIDCVGVLLTVAICLVISRSREHARSRRR